MRSTLFKNTSHEMLVKRLIHQCSFHGESSTVCAISLKMLLLDLKNHPNSTIQSAAQTRLESLTDQRIYIQKDDAIHALRFNIPTSDITLIDEIDGALRKISGILFPGAVETEIATSKFKVVSNYSQPL